MENVGFCICIGKEIYWQTDLLWKMYRFIIDWCRRQARGWRRGAIISQQWWDMLSDGGHAVSIV